MINGYNEGANITLLNVLYNRGDYKSDIADAISIVYKDLDTGRKGVQVIENPEFKYYLLKPEAKDSLELISYPGSFYRYAYDYDSVICNYKDLNLSIACNVGEENKYYDNVRNRDFISNRRYRKHYKVEGTDHNICDFYMTEFNRLYKNSPYPLTKSFLDIEVDNIKSPNDFPEMGECPINAVTYLLEEQKTSYTLILRNDENTQISEFEEELKNNQQKVLGELYTEIQRTMYDTNDIYKYGFSDMEFKFIFFDNEIELIRTIFLISEEFKPDFTLAWNMAFDIPYIIARIINLGYDPSIIMCDDDFSVKNYDYFIDIFNYNEYHKRTDYANISSYSVYIDQMIHFASVNSTKLSKYGNWKLDNIGNIVAKMRKLDYSDEVYSFKEFPYKNFKRFIYYNIIDVLVQVAIENMSKVVDFIFNKSLKNCTRYAKIHRQSVYLTNALRMNLELNGKILVTNRKEYNKDEIDDVDNEDKVGYPGAFVADPLLINDYSKTYVNGVPVMLYRNNFDFDYIALYPYTDKQFNIGHEAMIGKVTIDKDISYVNEPYNYKYFESGSHFIMSLQSNNFIGIGNQFLNLPDITEMYNYINMYKGDVIDV